MYLERKENAVIFGLANSKRPQTAFLTLSLPHTAVVLRRLSKNFKGTTAPMVRIFDLL